MQLLYTTIAYMIKELWCLSTWSLTLVAEHIEWLTFQNVDHDVKAAIYLLSIVVTNLLGDHLLGIMFPSNRPQTIMHMLLVQVDIPITCKDLLLMIACLLKPARLRIRIVGVCDSWEG